MDANTGGICRKCTKGIDDAREKTIFCDRCNGCIHQKCSEITREEFSYINKAKATTKLIYHCPVCVKELMDGNRADNAIAQQNAKLQNLAESVLYLIEQNKLLIAAIQTESSTVSENKVLLEEIKTGKNEEDIQVQLKEVIVDQSEIDEKKKHIIVFNLPEADETPDGKKEEEEDYTKVKEMLSFLDSRIDTNAIDMKNIERMGRRKGKDDRPRAIKVELPSVEMKFKAIRRAQKLKEYKTPKIGISFDKTRKEMKEDMILRKLLSDTKAADPAGDYVIFNKQLVTRVEATRLKEVRDANRGKPRDATRY